MGPYCSVEGKHVEESELRVVPNWGRLHAPEGTAPHTLTGIFPDQGGGGIIKDPVGSAAYTARPLPWRPGTAPDGHACPADTRRASGVRGPPR